MLISNNKFASSDLSFGSKYHSENASKEHYKDSSKLKGAVFPEVVDSFKSQKTAKLSKTKVFVKDCSASFRMILGKVKKHPTATILLALPGEFPLVGLWAMKMPVANLCKIAGLNKIILKLIKH